MSAWGSVGMTVRSARPGRTTGWADTIIGEHGPNREQGNGDDAKRPVALQQKRERDQPDEGYGEQPAGVTSVWWPTMAATVASPIHASCQPFFDHAALVIVFCHLPVSAVSGAL